MGIAARIAGMLRLHREETYALAVGSSQDDIVQAEQARRTFWSIKSHDNLYTQQHLPVAFANSEITALLPCSENDFSFGRVPARRAALAGTAPAIDTPALVSLHDRSMFATLVQIHDLWGLVARSPICSTAGGHGVQPWDSQSRYFILASQLRSWESNLPAEHQWSAWNLRGYQVEHVDLAYLSVITMTRMSNIVLRRNYIEDIVRHVLEPGTRKQSPPNGFWEEMSRDLFSGVLQLYEAINTYVSSRSPEDGFPTMLAFCAYTCGSLISYLKRWPGLCPEYASTAASVLTGTIEALSTFAEKWPLASEWCASLQEVAKLQEHESIAPVTECALREGRLNTIVGSHTCSMLPVTTEANCFQAATNSTPRGTFVSGNPTEQTIIASAHLPSEAHWSSFDSSQPPQYVSELNNMDSVVRTAQIQTEGRPLGPAVNGPAFETDFDHDPSDGRDSVFAADTTFADFMQGYIAGGLPDWQY